MVRGTTATRVAKSYKKNGKTVLEYETDLKKLAQEYSNWGNVPKTIGDMRAMEISLLAKAYLSLKEKETGRAEVGGE